MMLKFFVQLVFNANHRGLHVVYFPARGHVVGNLAFELSYIRLQLLNLVLAVLAAGAKVPEGDNRSQDQSPESSCYASKLFAVLK